MARDGHRERVGATRLRHRADRCWRAETPRDVGVAPRRSRRDLAQGLPDALLEGRPAHIERQVDRRRRCLNQPNDLRDQFLETCIATDELRVRKAILQVSEDRKSTRLNSSHGYISYAVFCL